MGMVERGIRFLQGDSLMPAQKTLFTPKVASFFAGIGGFDLGLERAGFDSAFQCELNPFCQAILARHWPDVKKAIDINDVNSQDVPFCDVWAGGVPVPRRIFG